MTLIEKERPDIVHCHNLLPQVSPAAYYACKSAGVPVVQTLHNYRMFCPAGTFFRNGRVCQDCTRSLAYAVKQGCYRSSRLQTATVAMMLAFHRHRETWTRSVDAYIALTQFSRNLFVALGLPDKKIHVKPNFLAHDPGQRSSSRKLRPLRRQAESGKGRSRNAPDMATPPAHPAGRGRRRSLV